MAIRLPCQQKGQRVCMLGAQGITFHLKHFTFLLFIFIIIYSTEPRCFRTQWPCIASSQELNINATLKKTRPSIPGAAPTKSPQRAPSAISLKVFWINPEGLGLQGRVCDLSSCMISCLLGQIFTVGLYYQHCCCPQEQVPGLLKMCYNMLLEQILSSGNSR